MYSCIDCRRYSKESFSSLYKEALKANEVTVANTRTVDPKLIEDALNAAPDTRKLIRILVQVSCTYL